MTRVAVVGATGYAGAELTAILARHPHVDLAAVYSGTDGASGPFAEIHPALRGLTGPDFGPFTVERVLASGVETVFLATPNEVSAAVAPQLVAAGIKVIDLSGAFRLQHAEDYPGWYGFEHPDPSLLREAVYGLTEWCDDELTDCRLIANPGCYPTAILLGLRPLINIIDREQAVICDAKSGVSGAGKKKDTAYSFAELAGNFKAYGVGHHRHEPELRQELHLGTRAPIVFVPHLLPTVRGILATIHVGFHRAVDDAEVSAMYEHAYRRSPFVRIHPAGDLPELRDVVNTPRAEIGFTLLAGGRRAVVVSVIDNLLKGAASQAVQNFNRVHRYQETEGLAWVH